ncbi:MAG: hypothetical protein JO187_13720 [Acidobacteria bacterium]|nr:hypothetical protein [Acidobacteriota bacterium]
MTHILGFQDAPKNSTGRLSIEADDLQFKKGEEDTPLWIKISSIRDFSTGETDKQVGGLPMTAAKAAVPFGGGRAVSLLAHKKYDTVTLEYVDASGGLHGAIFQLRKGQTLPEALAAKGVRSAPPEEKGETATGPAPQIQPATTSSIADDARGGRWSVEVQEVDPGEVAIEPAFRIAIYENLLHEVEKAKTFDQVFRSGNRAADSVSKLLIFKTTVEKYTAGSETRRAATTVTGATKITVRTQLCTRDGRVVWDQVSGANVRFMGGNLRVTNKVAHNVGRQMKSPRLDPVLETLDRERPGSKGSPVAGQ